MVGVLAAERDAALQHGDRLGEVAASVEDDAEPAKARASVRLVLGPFGALDGQSRRTQRVAVLASQSPTLGQRGERRRDLHELLRGQRLQRGGARVAGGEGQQRLGPFVGRDDGGGGLPCCCLGVETHAGGGRRGPRCDRHPRGEDHGGAILRHGGW